MSFWRQQYFWPSVLIVLGVYFLLNNMGWLRWLDPKVTWPVLVIALGVWLLVRRSRA
jgi:hypothetical protein